MECLLSQIYETFRLEKIWNYYIFYYVIIITYYIKPNLKKSSLIKCFLKEKKNKERKDLKLMIMNFILYHSCERMTVNKKLLMGNYVNVRSPQTIKTQWIIQALWICLRLLLFTLKTIVCTNFIVIRVTCSVLVNIFSLYVEFIKYYYNLRCVKCHFYL